MRVIVHPSPNHGARRTGPVDMLVLHYTGMASAEAAAGWLCDPRSGVSAHYLIGEEGTVFALVPEEARAWHAGVSSWAGEDDVNSRSIGIELQNPGHEGGLPAYADPQVEALIALSHTILARHPIPPGRVLAHSDVAPGRKVDPGERFPWARLAAAGIGLWADPAPVDDRDVLAQGDSGESVFELRKSLRNFGYMIELNDMFDDELHVAVTAFQRHWRPGRVDGRADRSTRDQLAELLARAGGG